MDSEDLEIFDLFVSYASEDREVVTALVHVLRTLRIRVWFDQSDLKVGDSLRKKLTRDWASVDSAPWSSLHRSLASITLSADGRVGTAGG